MSAFRGEDGDIRGAFSRVFRGRLTLPRLKQLRDKPRPPRLVRSADAASGVPVKVLVEQHVVSEIRVILQSRIVAEHRAPPLVVAKEQTRQACRELVRDLFDGMVPSGSR